MKLSIGEMERLTGLNRTTLRFYDTEELLQPERLPNGYRSYTGEDILRLVQIRQLGAFGLELSDLPSTHSQVNCDAVRGSLCRKAEAIEAEIEAMYQRLSRLHLHMDAYAQCQGNTPVTEDRTVGAYRVYYSQAGDDASVSAIFRRWLQAVPDTYSCIRIPQSALQMDKDAVCSADLGIGLLSAAFHRLGESLAPPIQYAPPCKCLKATVSVARPDRIPCSVLSPFSAYLEEHRLIPLGDFSGWVIYSPACPDKDPYRIALRLGIH